MVTIAKVVTEQITAIALASSTLAIIVASFLITLAIIAASFLIAVAKLPSLVIESFGVASLQVPISIHSIHISIATTD